MGRNRLYANNVVGENSWLPNLKEIAQILLTFALVSFSRIFFRSKDISAAFGYIENILTNFNFEDYLHPDGYRMLDYYILLAVFVVYEFIIRRNERNPFPFKLRGVRILAYSLVIFAMFLFYDDSSRAFIYFQF